MIDIHCHILPGLDDGSSDINESLGMAKMALSDNITHIVATPHTLNGFFENDPKKIERHLEYLNSQLIRHSINVNLYGGAEVHLCSDMAQKIENGVISTINNSKYCLLEFPNYSLPPGYQDEIFGLTITGITPVIVHPERLPIFHYDLSVLYKLISMGCVVQITAQSITGGFGKAAMKLSHQMLKRRLAHIIATDAHSLMHRPPILSTAVNMAAKILKDNEEAESMVVSRPRAILDGTGLDIPEPVPERKKKWFPRFFSKYSRLHS